MPTDTTLTLAELEECRESIIECIGEVQKIPDYAANELRTLEAALVYIEELINDFKPDAHVSERAATSQRKKSAA